MANYLKDINKILEVKANSFRTPEDILDYIRVNSEVLNTIINLSNSEIKKIEKPFYKFLNYYRNELRNNYPYNATYSNFLKIAILFLDKTNDIESIKNFLGYFEEKDRAYYWRIKAILEFRMLADIKELPDKLPEIINYLEKAQQAGEKEETLTPILETYFNKLFRQNEFVDPINREKYFRKIENEKYFKKYIENENLKDYFKNEIFLKIPKNITSYEYESEIKKVRVELELLNDEKLRLRNIIEKKNKTIEILNNKIIFIEKEKDKIFNQNISLSEKIDITEKRYNLKKFIEIKDFNKILIEKNKSCAQNNVDLKIQNEKLIELNIELKKERDLLKNEFGDLHIGEERDSPYKDTADNLGKNTDLITEIKSNIKIAIIGSESGASKLNNLKEVDKWFQKNDLNFKNLKYITSWGQELSYSIKNLSQFNVIIVGENDHVIKDLPSDYSKKCNGIYLFLKENFKDKKILLAKLDQNSTKRPQITKTNLKHNIMIGVDWYINNYLERLKIKPEKIA